MILSVGVNRSRAQAPKQLTSILKPAALCAQWCVRGDRQLMENAMQDNQLVNLTMWLRHETDKAMLMATDDGVEMWLPKSKIAAIHDEATGNYTVTVDRLFLMKRYSAAKAELESLSQRDFPF